MDRFFVYIVESPSHQDLFDGRTEGGLLRESLKLRGISTEYRLVTSWEFATKALASDLPNRWNELHLPPMLHFSLHGSQGGLHFTDGSVFDWNVLLGMFTQLNTMLNGGLILCFSTCFGAWGGQMARSLDATPPFYALVAHRENADWSDSALAFETFYHHMAKHGNIEVLGFFRTVDSLISRGSFGFRIGPG